MIKYQQWFNGLNYCDLITRQSLFKAIKNEQNDDKRIDFLNISLDAKKNYYKRV